MVRNIAADETDAEEGDARGPRPCSGAWRKSLSGSILLSLCRGIRETDSTEVAWQARSPGDPLAARAVDMKGSSGGFEPRRLPRDERATGRAEPRHHRAGGHARRVCKVTPAEDHMIDRIDHIVLNCRNIDATASWYERALGFRREIYSSPAAPGQRIALKFGQHKFNLRQTGDASWWTCKVDAPGSLDLCFVTEGSLKPVIAKLEAAGIPVVAGPAPRSGALGTHDLNLLRGSGWQSG